LAKTKTAIIFPAVAMGILPLQIDTVVFGMKFSSWRVLLVTNAAFTLISAVILFTVAETPKYVLVQGDENASLDTLRTMFYINTGRPRSEYPVKHIILHESGMSVANIHSFKDAAKMVWEQTVPLFNKERVLHTLNISFIIFVAYGMSQGVFVW